MNYFEISSFMEDDSSANPGIYIMLNDKMKPVLLGSSGVVGASLIKNLDLEQQHSVLVFTDVKNEITENDFAIIGDHLIKECFKDYSVFNVIANSANKNNIGVKDGQLDIIKTILFLSSAVGITLKSA